MKYMRALWRYLRARAHHWHVEENIADYEHQCRVNALELAYWTSQQSAASVDLMVAENELRELIPKGWRNGRAD